VTFTLTREMIGLQDAARLMQHTGGNSAIERMQRDVAEFQRIEQEVGAITAAEQAVQQFNQARAWNFLRNLNAQTRICEEYERVRQELAVFDRVRRLVHAPRIDDRALHRGQGATGKGKRSGKKAAKSASGGDSGGDGDGPQRKRAKNSRRTVENHSPVPPLPPGSTPGAIVTTSPQSPRPLLAPTLEFSLILVIASLCHLALFGTGAAQLIAVLSLIVYALCVIDKESIAKLVVMSAERFLKQSEEDSDDH
jgi:hypothetical protein